jgi:hypothetical protein
MWALYHAHGGCQARNHQTVDINSSKIIFNHLLIWLSLMINKYMENNYYIYYYIREKSSNVSEAGSPFYVGMGKGNRINRKGRGEVPLPKPYLRIKIVENLTIEQAKKLEILHIKIWGRIDQGTGILRNKTSGGDGTFGRVMSSEERDRRSVIQKEVQNRDDVKVKRSLGIQKSNCNPETRQRRREGGQRAMSDASARQRHKNAMKSWWEKTPNAKELASERAKAYWSDNTKVEEKREFAKTKWQDEEYRKKISESFAKTASTPEFKQKKRDCQLGLKFWNNGVENVRARECPPGYVRGRLKRKAKRLALSTQKGIED